jgi:hypothetical protein
MMVPGCLGWPRSLAAPGDSYGVALVEEATEPLVDGEQIPGIAVEGVRR